MAKTNEDRAYESDEEYDDFEELPTARSNYPELASPSKKPQSRIPSRSAYNAKSSLPEEPKTAKARSVMVSAMCKDDEKPSKAKSVMPSMMFKDDPKSSNAKSVMPSMMSKDDPKAPKAKSLMPSMIYKDDAKASKAKSVMPSMMFKDEQPFKSYIVTKEDRIMSQRQTQFASLPPKEQKKQEEWAQKIIKHSGACPEQYAWNRVDQNGWGGYLCAEGRHAMTDGLIQEGLGAILTLKVKKNFGNEGAERCGPWYPHPSIKNAYVFVKEKKIEGVKPYDHPAFFGSDNQRERAKWEYYSENPEDAIFMKYKKPEEEPPVAWATDNNVPKHE